MRATLFTLIIMIYGCSHQIHEGKIVDKIYEPERTYVYFTPMMCGKVTIMIAHTGYDDEDYILRVHGHKDKKCITENFYVSKENFNCHNIGEHFNDTIIPCSTEDPIKQIK